MKTKIQNFITINGIKYDKNAVPFLTDYEINLYTNLQIKHTETINLCFMCLQDIIENKDPKSMKEIYCLLTNLNEHHNNMQMIDNWVLFIKSQNGFSSVF